MGGNRRIDPIAQNGITGSQDSCPDAGICRALMLSGHEEVPEHLFFAAEEQMVGTEHDKHKAKYDP